jgi:hypothetical protein
MFSMLARLRPSAAGLLVVAALALSPSVSAAPCADPSGVCPNGGQVTFTNPSPPSNITTQNPNPPRNVNVQNPNPPTNVDVQNPNPPTNVDVTNPTGGDSGAQNPNVPIVAATTGQLTLSTDSAGPGDMVAVSGQGFGAKTQNLMFLNVIDSSGQILDTDSRAFSCVETDNVLLNLYQDLGWGCGSGARPGPLNQSTADGTFVGAIQNPATAAPGPAQLCAKGVFPTSCTPITIASSDS